MQMILANHRSDIIVLGNDIEDTDASVETSSTVHAVVDESGTDEGSANDEGMPDFKRHIFAFIDQALGGEESNAEAPMESSQENADADDAPNNADLDADGSAESSLQAVWMRLKQSQQLKEMATMEQMRQRKLRWMKL